MPTSTLTSKGQTTIPKKVREFMQLSPGDKLEFVIRDDGQVILQPANVDLAELDGLLHVPDRPATSVEEMNEAARSEATRLHNNTSS